MDTDSPDSASQLSVPSLPSLGSDDSLRLGNSPIGKSARSKKTGTPFRIQELWIYPIKSVAGIRVEEAKMTTTGLQCDRQWMFVEEHGSAITSTEAPTISRMRTRFVNDGQDIELRSPVRSEVLILPAFPKWRYHSSELKIIPIEIAGTYGTAFDFSSSDHPLKKAITAFCQACFTNWAQPPRLVFQAEARHVRSILIVGCRTTNFAYSYPIRIASRESLRHLNAHMIQERVGHSTMLPSKRGAAKRKKLSHPAAICLFRPNIVVSGGSPWAEGDWRKVRFGSELTLEILDGAPHHKRDTEIWRALADLEGIDQDGEDLEDPAFGSLASALLSPGELPVLSIGDAMEVVETSDLPVAIGDFPQSVALQRDLAASPAFTGA